MMWAVGLISLGVILFLVGDRAVLTDGENWKGTMAAVLGIASIIAGALVGGFSYLST